jgi:hypothetical protein
MEPDVEPAWDELVLDNLWVQWQRPGELPITVKVGRQDMIYGRGLIIIDGTPLDGSRTLYNDAIKVTLHLDEIKTDVDAFYIDNNGRQSRVHPVGHDDRLTSEYDAQVAGVYAISRILEGQELHAYYVYKNEDPIGRFAAPPLNFADRIVHTVGALAQGRIEENWDYYGELAFQWGKEMRMSRRGIGASADLGYTFLKCTYRPRVHVAYMYLSGNNPGSGRFEGWDPVLSRFPHFSELIAFRWAGELGRPGYYTNLQRFGTGVRVHATPKMCVDLDYNFLRANEHNLGTAGLFDSGKDRGHLLVAKLSYTFSERLSGHLWAEYFEPGSFYTETTDEAFFLRWQVNFTF